MVRTKHDTEFAGALHPSVDTFLIEIGSEQVHAIRTAHIIEPVSIHVPDARTVRRFDDRSDPEMMMNILLVLERNAVGIHKSQIGDASLKLFAQRDRFGEALAKELGQSHKSLLALLFNVGGRGIAGKKREFRICVCGNPARYSSSQPWMTLKRSVLCAR